MLPNGLKLSDRHRRSQACHPKKTGTPVPVRWSAWLGGAVNLGEGGTDNLVGVVALVDGEEALW